MERTFDFCSKMLTSGGHVLSGYSEVSARPGEVVVKVKIWDFS